MKGRFECISDVNDDGGGADCDLISGVGESSAGHLGYRRWCRQTPGKREEEQCSLRFFSGISTPDTKLLWTGGKIRFFMGILVDLWKNKRGRKEYSHGSQLRSWLHRLIRFNHRD